MKKILCPTDFSDAAHNAIAYASKLAHAINGEITLLHVHSLFDLTTVEGTAGTDTQYITSQLEAQSAEINKTFRIPCDVVVESTFRTLTTVIHDTSSNYDIIVMGTNGPDNIYQFLLGSNAYNAAVKSKTPVLIIPENYVYSEITSIVYAFDYLKEQRLPFKELIAFASALKCEITILQIMELAESKGADEDLKELQIIMENLYSGDVPLKYDTIHSDDIAHSINSYISKAQPDALAMCSVHLNVVQRMFHKSVIKNIAATSDFPLFVFHG